MPCHGNWEWNLLLSQDENFAFSQNAALREVQCIILHGGGGGDRKITKRRRCFIEVSIIKRLL